MQLKLNDVQFGFLWHMLTDRQQALLRAIGAQGAGADTADAQMDRDAKATVDAMLGELERIKAKRDHVEAAGRLFAGRAPAAAARSQASEPAPSTAKPSETDVH